MVEKKTTADDLARRIGGLLTEDRSPPVLIGPTGTSPATRRDVGFKNPMAAAGDLIRGGTSGAATRLGIGSNGQVLTVVAGAPAWATATGGSAVVRDLLTNGSLTSPELIFADGDVIWIE